MADHPTRGFEESPPTNRSDVPGGHTPPTTADIPDSSEVDVARKGEGFTPGK